MSQRGPARDLRFAYFHNDDRLVARPCLLGDEHQFSGLLETLHKGCDQPSPIVLNEIVHVVFHSDASLIPAGDQAADTNTVVVDQCGGEGNGDTAALGDDSHIAGGGSGLDG